ncbi:MAG: hypothetical protein ACK4M6_01180 [Hyphomonas sp.]
MKNPPTVEIIGLVAGFAIWSSAFVMLYALHGGACDGGWFSDLRQARGALAAVLALHLLLHVALCVWLWRRLQAGDRRSVIFLRTASFVLAICAAGATLWTSAPVLVLQICDGKF